VRCDECMCASDALALTNKVYMSPADCDAFDSLRKKGKDQSRYVQIKEFIYTYECVWRLCVVFCALIAHTSKHEDVPASTLGLTGVQRTANGWQLLLFGWIAADDSLVRENRLSQAWHSTIRSS
jgi:hypothetical protein